jgi:hypothetical protein
MLTSAQIRTFTLELANSPAWTLLVRPEIDRQIAAYEAEILNSTTLTDRNLADTRTKYHALQRLLKDLSTTVSSSLTGMSAEDQIVLTPAMHEQLSSVFSLHPAAAGTSSSPAPRPPIVFPPTHTFNPFSSPPPPEEPAS